MMTVRSFCEAFYKVLGNDAEASRAAQIVSQRIAADRIEQALSWDEAALYLVQSMISDDQIEAEQAARALGLASVFLTVPGTQTIMLEPDVALKHPIIVGWVADTFLASVSTIMQAGAYRAAFAITSPFITGAEVRSAGASTSALIDYRFPICGGAMADVRATYGHPIEADYMPALASMTRSRRISGSALLSLGGVAVNGGEQAAQASEDEAEPATTETGVFTPPVLH